MLALPLGATGDFLMPDGRRFTAQELRASEPGWVRIAVAGAHLRGQPLHPALLSMGARFVRSCRTAALYRFVALMDLKPPRPGLIRDEARSGATAVEIFELTDEGFGKLVASVAPPLAIGTVELEDGEKLKGFLCESWAAATARDITDFGSWIAFLAIKQTPATGKARHDRTHDAISLGSCWLLPSLLAGCGGRSKRPTDGQRPLVIGFLYIGARDDYGYNQAHAQGAAAIKKLPGVVVKEEEMVADTMDAQKTMKGMIELNGASVLFPTSFGYYDPHVLRLAAKYPEVKFLHCGGLWDETKHPANIGTYYGFIDECQYLSGIVAAHATKTKKLGFVAGKAIPQVRRNINAFTMGARSVDPSISCVVIFTGDWSLPVKEAEATLNLIDQGVDVMTCHVNSPKVMVEQAERRGVFTCGYHVDQAVLAPKKYLTGAEWNWEKVYTDYVNDIRAGQWTPGLTRGGLKEGFVKMSPYGPEATPAARKAADAIKTKFLDGSFVIFKGPLKDNAGKVVIAEGTELPQTATELEKMEYLVEGVIGR